MLNRCSHAFTRPLRSSSSPSSTTSLNHLFVSFSACRTNRRGTKIEAFIKLQDLPQGLISLDPLPHAKEGLPSSQRAVKTTSSSVKLEHLPQGMTPLDPLPPAQEVQYPTVLQQARINMQRLENCVLLTRVGGFYEIYFEHAEEFAPLLNLKLAHRKTGAGLVPMAGFPFFQLDRYLKILVQDLNQFVAVADEFPNETDSAKIKAGGLLHDRRVTRIVSPGTLIDETFIDPFANNYVLAIHLEDSTCLESEFQQDDSSIIPAPETRVGVAWLDLTTGSFFTQSTTAMSLASLLSRIAPREIVLDERLRASGEHGVLPILADDRRLVTYFPSSNPRPMSEWADMFETSVSPEEAAKFSPEEVGASSSVLQYIKTRLPGFTVKLQPPIQMHGIDAMGIDKNSMRALEITETIRDGLIKGSLLQSVRRTVTASGARLLRTWLTSPSTSIEVIDKRLNLVTRFIKDELLRERVAVLLRRTHDSQRLVQKFSYGRGEPDDLLALAKTIDVSRQIVSTLQESAASIDGQSELADSLVNVVERFDLEGPHFLATHIMDSIDEDGVEARHQIEEGEAGQMMALAKEIATSEGSAEDLKAVVRKKKPTSMREHYSDINDSWVMRPIASPLLRRLHTKLYRLAEEKVVLAEDLRNQLGAATLTLRWTPQLGHICHVKGKDLRDNPPGLRSVSSSKSTRSFHHPDWTDLGQRIDQMKLQIRGAEQKVFLDLRAQVILNLVKLRRNARILDELDVALSFATLAIEKSFVRPILNKSTNHKIVGGRHPTVESGLREEGRSFITNDCFVGSAERLWLVTGPNMAGKSTFLRQNALITILAQVGSYVPAEFAEIGIVDQIFSRVGSADNLYKDQSTFMVEMLETATILRQATARSFVVMDEIGRGTTPQDGIAVAYACLHHLLAVNKCRTLFATHFHALADLCDGREDVGFYCTDVKEYGDGGFSYVHRLRKGVNRDSHALKVAKLAGLPEAAILMAKEVLEKRKGETELYGCEVI